MDSDGVNTGACKLQKLSTVCSLDTETLIDSSSDIVMSASSLLSDDTGDCVHQTIDLLPNLEAGSVSGIFCYVAFCYNVCYIVLMVLTAVTFDSYSLFIRTT